MHQRITFHDITEKQLKISTTARYAYILGLNVTLYTHWIISRSSRNDNNNNINLG